MEVMSQQQKSSTNTKKFTGTPIIAYTTEASRKKALKAAIRWQGSLERSLVSKHLFSATVFALNLRMKSFRADSGGATVGTLTICCVTFIAQDRKLAFYDSQCTKEKKSVLLNLHLKKKKQRRKNSHCGLVTVMAALCPLWSCLYQLHYFLKHKDGTWQLVLCWWEEFRDEMNSE